MLRGLVFSTILNNQSVKNETKWVFCGKTLHYVFYIALVWYRGRTIAGHKLISWARFEDDEKSMQPYICATPIYQVEAICSTTRSSNKFLESWTWRMFLTIPKIGMRKNINICVLQWLELGQCSEKISNFLTLRHFTS